MGGNPRLSGTMGPLGMLTRRQVLISVGASPWAAPRAASPAPVPVRLPHDFGAHPDTRTEWWYATGSLEAGGRTWGFQVTFFRSATGLAPGHPSRFAAQQLIVGHAAVTDLAAGRQHHDQRIARSGFGIASAEVGRTAVHLRDWHLVREDDGRYRTRVDSPARGFGFDLRFTPTQPPLLQGRDGWSQKGADPRHATCYYSEPQLAVSGTLDQDGTRLPVQGLAWLDHEWGDALLAPDVTGWDWIGMNLDDGGALTAFQLRRPDGRAAWAGGSFRAAGGPVRAFAADEVVFTPGRTWHSPASQATYPVTWEVATPIGRLAVASRLDAQELDSRASTGTRYWEGLSDLLRDGRPIGRGYLEMTGYAGRLAL